MPATLHRAALPCLVLVCLAADRPAPLRATAPAAPETMHGTLRYRVRGLSAVQGGFMAGTIMAVAHGVGMQSAVLNLVRLVSGMAKLAGDPSVGQFETYLRTGKGYDFSGAPVSAGSDLTLDFLLEGDGKGRFHLKSGTARYAGSTDAEFTHKGADGSVRITDVYRADRSVALTPENASITLSMTGKGKDQKGELDVAVSFPVKVAGKSTWTTDIMEIFFRDNGDVYTSGLKFLGQQHSDQSPSSPIDVGVTYGSGRRDSILKGRETWQDLRDSGVLVEWELWSRCDARMVTPRVRDELVYDTLRPGRISRIASADVKPSFFGEDLEWDFHPISGSRLEFREIDALGPRPQRSRGNIFEARYDTLPPQNSSFAFWDVSTRFVTGRARRAGCKDPAPRRVGYFFARDASNHGGPPGVLTKDAKPKGPTPNWLHYWMQTKARVRLAPTFVRYEGRGPGCYGTTVDTVDGTPIARTGPLAYAHYTLGDRHIVMCDLAMPGLDFRGWNPLRPFEPTGIDLFAATLLHEKQHHDNYWAWWSTGYARGKDQDRDGIPDAIEKGVPVPPEVRTKRRCFDPQIQGPCFNPKTWDTFGYKIDDEHYLAWAAMFRWPLGSANREDWSCPGKLSKGRCK